MSSTLRIYTIRRPSGVRLMFSRFYPRRFTSQGTTAPQVRGQPIAMSEKSSNFAAESDEVTRSSHAHRTFIALPSHTRRRVAAMSPAGVPVALRSRLEACDVLNINNEQALFLNGLRPIKQRASSIFLRQ